MFVDPKTVNVEWLMAYSGNQTEIKTTSEAKRPGDILSDKSDETMAKIKLKLPPMKIIIQTLKSAHRFCPTHMRRNSGGHLNSSKYWKYITD